MQQLTLRTPDDFHLHFRDGDMLPETVAATARCFARAIAMPNLLPPVTTTAQALAYRQRILAAVPTHKAFQPLMTLYLTNDTTAEEIRRAKDAGILACKLYPAGATTNSDAAVSEIEGLKPVLAAMQECGMLLLVHGEVTEAEVDIFDREAQFIERYLAPIHEEFSELKIVFEHITTADAAAFVKNAGERIAATITPQHLMLNRNDLLVGGVKPHYYCLPVLKRREHQLALREVVASGHPRFFLGTDSAPHAKHKKESACGCAGCYSAWSAIELYAQVFEELGCLDKLEAFASENGARFYGLPLNEGQITLVREHWQVPESITLPNGESLVPFMAGETLNWKLKV